MDHVIFIERIQKKIYHLFLGDTCILKIKSSLIIKDYYYSLNKCKLIINFLLIVKNMLKIVNTNIMLLNIDIL